MRTLPRAAPRVRPLTRLFLVLPSSLLVSMGCGEGPFGIEGQCDPASAQAAFLSASGEDHEHGAEPGGETLVGIHFAEDALPEDGWPDDVGDGTQSYALFGESGPRGITLYLNRQGGQYLDGASDSARNRSPIVPCGTAELASFAGDDAQWDEVVSCVADQFAPFDVEITDEEPTSGSYIEAVIGDHPSALGLPNNVGGIAPMDTYGCSVLSRAVVFVFSERIGEQNTQRVCEVAAQEVAHALGLDHEFLCEDPMSYLRGCGAKTFQNVDARCGEHESRDCACGAETQNSVQLLAERVGMRDGGAPPSPPVDEGAPDVTVESSGVVDAQARVSAKIVDDVSVSRVDLLWEEGGEEHSFRCPGSSERAACRREGDRFVWNISVGADVDARFRIRAEDPSGRVTITDAQAL